jgi:uncharacterized membrane protein (UPF0127 family)
MNLIRWFKNNLPSRRRPDPPQLLHVLNVTQRTLIATEAETAGQSSNRRRGLLGRTTLSSGQGLWIVPCEAVHTFGMKFAIDLIYLDRNMRVRKTKSDVPPWRVSACLSAHSVLELTSGTVQKTNTRHGDRIEFSSVDSTHSELK